MNFIIIGLDWKMYADICYFKTFEEEEDEDKQFLPKEKLFEILLNTWKKVR